MFYRKVVDELIKWSEQKDRKPLILRGARQTGKTTAVNIFAENFDNYLYLNLENKRDADLFEHNLSTQELVQAICLYKHKSTLHGKILLFLDEIQNSPQAVSMMRDFYESEKQLYVIAAGSLLETMMGYKQISFPVGRVQYLFMYPLTFKEFLSALNESETLAYLHEMPIPDFAHSRLMELFHKYTLIGGMPEVVKKYIETNNIQSLTPIYQGLLTSFLDDVSKYARNENMKQVIMHTIESVPLSAGKRIKFQGFGKSNYKSREIGEALKTLQRAMLVYLIYPITSTEVPIIPDLKKSPKLQFLDTGLLNYYGGLQEYFFLKEDIQAIYNGTVAEHITGQELMAIDMNRPTKFPFWVREKKQSNAEVDYVISYKNYLIPVEVKSGKTGTLRSLHQYINLSKHPYAIRIHSSKLSRIKTRTPQGKDYTLINLPFYLVGRINECMSKLIECS